MVNSCIINVVIIIVVTVCICAFCCTREQPDAGGNPVNRDPEAIEIQEMDNNAGGRPVNRVPEVIEIQKIERKKKKKIKESRVILIPA